MKSFKVYILFILIVIGFDATAQYDSIFAVVSGDTVTLWQTGAYRNCGSLYWMEINQIDRQIDWYQVDSGMAAFCYCTFDLSVTYGPLAPGNYNVNVYYTESYSPMDTIFEDTTSFTIGTINHGVTSGIISQYQSNCYSGFEDPETDNNYFRIYPVPVRDGGIMHIEVGPITGSAILDIFSVNGKLVFSRSYEIVQSIQEELTNREVFRVPGLYFVRLRTPDQIYVRKINVL